ncbi:Peptidase M23 [Desulfonatronospira thiodismutans ASO3-1]|uniref:Peptidase M23 n=1 Tax=Desulfonatronospira thiodismutans ASO3-1 TaxID=555779 RepID=D6SS30_9BACT|nr:peptidoglycan DD-metalloendopeptidase family protein [Desulfonatronospira sp. MSAO_Bac3]EFI33496.1 Peptidase M23 [Desulfonatronospira thiodismutans ASO3-1]RQD74146.1 MAG: peptidase M23 [Desulfonatronospira sp. MSAO_Bac3]
MSAGIVFIVNTRVTTIYLLNKNLFPGVLNTIDKAPAGIKNTAGMLPGFSLLIILLLCFIMLPGPAPASHPEDIESEIESRREEVSEHKRTLDRLSTREREVYSRLAETEDRLDEISRDLQNQEEKLADLQAREARIFQEYQDLSRERDKTRSRARDIMADLWPIYIESRSQGLADMQDWAEMDRQVQWLRAIHQEMNITLARLHEQTRQITGRLADLQSAKEDFEDQLGDVNALKDRLLEKKLKFVRELQEIRAEKLAREEMVEEIMDVIESLNYRLKVVTEREFEELKGHLPWPASGEVKMSFSPSDSPPHNGKSISLEENAPVRAISWGKVVHNDTLRGFGRVVIIFHGDDYYSLYAYLSESTVAIGQDVEQGETIGKAGYYPEINTHGIYFELRLQQKPINPDDWLSKS